MIVAATYRQPVAPFAIRPRLTLGDANENIRYGQTAAAIGVTAASSAGWIAASAVPVIGVGIAAVGLALTAIFNRKSGKQKTAATTIVEDLEPIMEDNLNAYMNGPRTIASQAAALENFDRAWAGIAGACGDPNLGDAGKRCISERQRGGKYDLFRRFRDPIANDTAKTQAQAIALSAETIVQGNPWIVPAGLLGLAAVIALSGGKH